MALSDPCSDIGPNSDINSGAVSICNIPLAGASCPFTTVMFPFPHPFAKNRSHLLTLLIPGG